MKIFLCRMHGGNIIPKKKRRHSAIMPSIKIGFAYSTPLPLNLEGWGFFLLLFPA